MSSCSNTYAHGTSLKLVPYVGQIPLEFQKCDTSVWGKMLWIQLMAFCGIYSLDFNELNYNGVDFHFKLQGNFKIDLIIFLE